MKPEWVCLVKNCNKPTKAKGLCKQHYARERVYGDAHQHGVIISTGWGEPLDYVHQVALSHTSDDCLIWPFSVNKNGYGSLSTQGVKSSANRYICEQAHGPAPNKDSQAAHSCGRGHEGCCSPIHLRWASPQENQDDRKRHGTSNYKANQEVLNEILQLRDKGHSFLDIAVKVKMTKSGVNRAIKRHLAATSNPQFTLKP